MVGVNSQIKREIRTSCERK